MDYNAPNTRERVAARRAQGGRGKSPRRSTGAAPGPLVQTLDWVSSGRIAGLALLLLAGGGLAYALLSDRFLINSVHVNGAELLAAETIAQIADVGGQPVWLVDRAAVVARLEANPYVEHAEASVSLPDVLEVQIRERTPEVRWQQAGQHYTVDATGLVLGLETSAPLSGTVSLVIDDRTVGAPLKPNARVDPSALRLAERLALVLPNDVQITPESYIWDAAGGLTVRSADGRTIIFGYDDRLDTKLAVLKAITRSGAPFALLDLRPNTPYFRQDDGAKPTATPTP